MASNPTHAENIYFLLRCAFSPASMLDGLQHSNLRKIGAGHWLINLRTSQHNWHFNPDLLIPSTNKMVWERTKAGCKTECIKILTSSKFSVTYKNQEQIEDMLLTSARERVWRYKPHEIRKTNWIIAGWLDSYTWCTECLTLQTKLVHLKAQKINKMHFSHYILVNLITWILKLFSWILG